MVLRVALLLASAAVFSAAGVIGGDEVLSLPRLMYGTAWKKGETARLTVAALQLGVRAVDTANQPRHYREAAVGDALRQAGLPRESLWIQTKFTPPSGQDEGDTPYDRGAPIAEQARSQTGSTPRAVLAKKTFSSYCLRTHASQPKRRTMSAYLAYPRCWYRYSSVSEWLRSISRPCWKLSVIIQCTAAESGS